MGKLILREDPVFSGFSLNYSMDGGPRYAIDLTAPSKTFRQMILLIFLCGDYLRNKRLCMVTDSAFGFLTGMCFFDMWGVVRIACLRIARCRGFLVVDEFQELAKKAEADQNKESKGRFV